jgi:hypothetical protein
MIGGKDMAIFLLILMRNYFEKNLPGRRFLEAILLEVAGREGLPNPDRDGGRTGPPPGRHSK